MPYFKACLCSYCGDNYAGWQRQKNATGIQNIIENVLSQIYCTDIKITGSGRTDSKVHAEGVVFNFSADKYFSNNELLRALNSILPKDIAILQIVDVTNAFHSGKSVYSKTYEYKIYNNPVHNPFLSTRALWIKNKIDTEKLRNILKLLNGTHDFESFCVKKTKKENTVRTIYFTDVIVKDDSNISLFFNAGGFLHNMVRIITGSALKIIRDNEPAETIISMLESKNRSKAGPTAPPYALYQKYVYYNKSNIPGLDGIPDNLLIKE